MSYTDLSPEQLDSYRSSQRMPADFDDFWNATLAEARDAGGDVTVDKVEVGLEAIEVFDVTFPGFGGEPIRGWLKVPAHRSAPLPAIVEYIGYGGGRARPIEHLLWAAAGFAHFRMDTRGQGSMWSAGATGDSAASGPQAPGFMTRGIESPETYYYRRLITDAVRAVDAVRGMDVVDAERVAVMGHSQGGGLSLAVGGLVEGLRAVIPREPFLCDFPRSIRIHDVGPYPEIVHYLAVHRERVGAVENTLAYVDGVNFARRATAPGYFTTALMDATCKPSTVFGAFHEYAASKEMTVWPFNEHAGGGPDGDAVALEILREALA